MKTIIMSANENKLKKIFKFIEKNENYEIFDCVLVETNDKFLKNIKSLIENEINIDDVDLVLLSDSDKDLQIASVLTVLMDGSCSTNCTNIFTDKDRLFVEREVFGGIANLNLLINKKTAIVTLAESLLNDQVVEGSNCQIRKIEALNEKNDAKILSKTKIEKSVDITSASRIVSIGRGIGQKEKIEIIEKLAKKLGAEVGCSRPISEDYEWLPIERQVGLTGETVKPELYFAVGISGQVQHLVGMRDSKIVVAINNNKSAPIFEYCDYGIVGDLFEIVPLLEKSV